MTYQPLKISAVVYSERGTWIGQCLEYDISCEADSSAELHEKLMKHIVVNMAISIEMGKAPLEGIKPAPRRFWKMFEQSRLTIEGEYPPMRTPNSVPPVNPVLKLADLAA